MRPWHLLFLFSFFTCALKERETSPPPSPNPAPVTKKSLAKPKKGEAAWHQLRGLPLADVHLHTRNYIQEGVGLTKTYEILSSRGVKRAAVFGIPLQQRWDMHTGVAPGYYLHDDQTLYYYSAIDALIAAEYQRLPRLRKKMFDPMIVGFNPTDGRATDHIRNMLLTFPGVFSGIGEFSIKKEVVSSKIAGGAANIEDPALGRILDFAAETGLVVLFHCDLDAMISHNSERPTYLQALRDLFRRHSKTTIIWAHTGLGRYVKARARHTRWMSSLLAANSNLHLDISWDVVAEQFFRGDKLAPEWKNFLQKHSERILFGSDVVAPTFAKYDKLLGLYGRIWRELPQAAVKNIIYGNYVRLFDRARTQVRTWEKQNKARN